MQDTDTLTVSQEQNRKLQEEFKAKWETRIQDTEKQIDMKKTQFERDYNQQEAMQREQFNAQMLKEFRMKKA